MNPLFDFRMPPSWHSEFDQLVTKLAAEQTAAVNRLTKEQLSSALQQALACGDFQRLVVASSDRQAVVYLPFRESEQLKQRIRELETRLACFEDVSKNACPCCDA